MVVKSATKKKLMDMLVPEEYAHLLADDRKWDDVKILTALEISSTCKIDSETAGKIHGLISSVAQGSGKDTSGDGSGSTTVVRRRSRRKRAKIEQILEEYDLERKMSGFQNIYVKDNNPVYFAPVLHANEII